MEKNLQNLIQFRQILKTTSIKELIEAKQDICLELAYFLTNKGSKELIFTGFFNKRINSSLKNIQYSNIFVIDNVNYLIKYLVRHRNNTLTLYLVDVKGNNIVRQANSLSIENVLTLVNVIIEYFKSIMSYVDLYNDCEKYYVCEYKNNEVVKFFTDELTAILSPYIKQLGLVDDYIVDIIASMIQKHFQIVSDTAREICYIIKLDNVIATDEIAIYNFPKEVYTDIKEKYNLNTKFLFTPDEIDKIYKEVLRRLCEQYEKITNCNINLL